MQGSVGSRQRCLRKEECVSQGGSGAHPSGRSRVKTQSRSGMRPRGCTCLRYPTGPRECRCSWPPPVTPITHRLGDAGTKSTMARHTSPLYPEVAIEHVRDGYHRIASLGQRQGSLVHLVVVSDETWKVTPQRCLDGHHLRRDDFRMIRDPPSCLSDNLLILDPHAVGQGREVTLEPPPDVLQREIGPSRHLRPGGVGAWSSPSVAGDF